MIKKTFLFYILCIFTSTLALAGGDSPSAGEDLAHRLQWLKSTPGKTSDFEKKVYQELQGRTESSKGQFFVRKGSLKISVSEPNPTLLVVNSDAVWLETSMGEDFPVSVQKMKRKSLKGNNEIWNVLMGSANLNSFFKVSKKKVESGLEFQLEPKKTGSSDLASAKFLFKDGQLKELSYKDDIQNVVTYIFKNWDGKKMTAKDFAYSPPKNAEVTEL